MVPSRKLAICNETFADWPLEKAVQYAADAGYRGWEVAPFMLAEDIRRFGSEERRAYRQTVEAAGLEIIGLHWLLAKTEGLHLTTEDEATSTRTADYLIELARLCRDLGGSVMVFGSPQQRNVSEGQEMSSAMKRASSVIRQAVPTFEECSVKLALEPLGPEEGNFLNTAAQARQLQAMIDSPQVGLHLDVKAMSSEATPIPQLIHENAEALLHFHANDPNRQGPGMGDVDFRPIFKALDEVGYDGWISVEVFDYVPGVERLVSESMNNMRVAMAG